jgi:hypothetical protein
VVQKTVRKEADKIYPPIIWRSAVYGKAGKQCVRVEIEHSGDTPHFGGPAWVRRGSVTLRHIRQHAHMAGQHFQKSAGHGQIPPLANAIVNVLS